VWHFSAAAVALLPTATAANHPAPPAQLPKVFEASPWSQTTSSLPKLSACKLSARSSMFSISVQELLLITDTNVARGKPMQAASPRGTLARTDVRWTIATIRMRKRAFPGERQHKATHSTPSMKHACAATSLHPPLCAACLPCLTTSQIAN